MKQAIESSLILAAGDHLGSPCDEEVDKIEARHLSRLLCDVSSEDL